MCGKIDAYTLGNLWDTVVQGSSVSAELFIDHLMSAGFPVATLLEEIERNVVTDNELFADVSKGIICRHLAKTEKNISDGSSEYLQLISLVGTLIRNVQQKR